MTEEVGKPNARRRREFAWRLRKIPIRGRSCVLKTAGPDFNGRQVRGPLRDAFASSPFLIVPAFTSVLR